MTGHDTETEPESGADNPADGDVSPCCHAYVERNERGPDSCTIYEIVNAESVADTWIKARGDAFVSREDTR
ncbi:MULTISPECIES: DUF7511 domain-containing protein [Natrialbaceae]|uniref:DUF7511 domain-containing protein n=1 Tax=Natrialbaceae TaxID=1644061 RepID=UPI00207CF1ED|nr:hypothetical protein [Natronococcus sp. CG52]